MPENQTQTTIVYPDSFFADVVNQCAIAEVSGKTITQVQTIYNVLKDTLQMDTESRIKTDYKRMLCLEHFQLFMHLLHGMHMFYIFRMKMSNPPQNSIEEMFQIIVGRFYHIAEKILKFGNIEETWTEIEINTPSVRDDVWSLLLSIGRYCDNMGSSTPRRGSIVMPPSYFEDDEEESTDEEKFREQQILQDMEISRMTWAVARIIIFLEAAVTTCCFVGLGLIVGLVFVSICDQSGKYDLDINYTRCVMMIAAVLGIANIRKIFNYFRENSNDRW